jgi:hypothetical protein
MTTILQRPATQRSAHINREQSSCWVRGSVHGRARCCDRERRPALDQQDLGTGHGTVQWIIIAYGLMLGGSCCSAAGWPTCWGAGTALIPPAALSILAVTGGLLRLAHVLNRGADSGWASASTLGLFAASTVTLAAFVRIEARVPGSALRNRTLAAANVSALFTFGAVLSFIFLGALLMQDVLAYSPTRTGVAWLAAAVMSIVAAAISFSSG